MPAIMRTLYAVCILLSALLSRAQDLNLGFEQWHPSVTDYLFEGDPFDTICGHHLLGDSIGRTNFLSDTGIVTGWSSSIFGTFRTNDAHSGRYAAVIHLWYNGAPAYLSLGVCDDLFTKKCVVTLPEKLHGVSGFYKYIVDPGSEGSHHLKHTCLNIITYRKNSISGELEVLTADSLHFAESDIYSEFYLPVSYPDQAQTPDSISIWFSSEGYGTISCVHDHYLYLDDLMFHYEPRTTSTGQTLLQDNLHISPNPAAGTIRLAYDEPARVRSIRLTDITGRLIRTFPADSLSLDITGIASGLYLLVVDAAEGRMTARIAVQQ